MPADGARWDPSAARDWASNGKARSWLVHDTERLRTAQQLLERRDLAVKPESTERAYLAACRQHARRSRMRLFLLMMAFSYAILCYFLFTGSPKLLDKRAPIPRRRGLSNV
jgi:hypothetical protein